MRARYRGSHRTGAVNLLLDLGLSGALVLALAIVIGIDCFWLSKPSSDPVGESATEVVANNPQPAAQKLMLGVAPEIAEFDDMGRLLDTLGEGYKYRKFSLDDLLDPARLGEFDIIFVTCSGYPQQWLGETIGASERGGQVSRGNEAVLERAKQAVRKFVGAGGTLYASDLHFVLIANCFPEFLDRPKVNEGKVQTISAQVVDPGLKELIGNEIQLRFDQPGWRPAAFSGEKVITYLRGSYDANSGGLEEAPLLVKFPFEKGTVIFTSFHNEKQNDEKELELLKYLVFTAVTASADAEVTKTMVSGGFAPSKQNLFNATANKREESRTYHCASRAHLQFALGIPNQGGLLRLTVTGPDGKTQTKEGSSTFSIDVPDAAPGDWKYTIAAVKVPNENFPFTVTVGQKK